jgi:hypothetical protein
MRSGETLEVLSDGSGSRAEPALLDDVTDSADHEIPLVQIDAGEMHPNLLVEVLSEHALRRSGLGISRRCSGCRGGSNGAEDSLR